MKTDCAPQEIEKLIIEWTEDKDDPSYGQFATASKGGHPHVRTVHFRYSEFFNTLVIACHTESSKWKDLLNNPQMSGCLFSHKRLVQIRWESDVRLISGDTTNIQEKKLLTILWQQIRPDVRQAYWNDMIVSKKSHKHTSTKRCPSFGAVIMYPYLWDIYKLGKESYLDGIRFIYTLHKNEWKKKKASIVSSKFF